MSETRWLRTVWVLAMLALLPVVAVAAEEGAGTAADSTARARAVADGWPDTPAGIVASLWVDAFSEGEEAMVAFLESNLPDSSLAKRPVEDRIDSYTKLQDRFGSLMLESVADSKPDELTVVLLAEDASKHRFIFAVAKESPHTLVQVGMMQGHGGGHH